MDNGPQHFRTYELLHVMMELQEHLNVPVQWNHFGEYHGKNICDTHFSLVSRLVESAEKKAKQARLHQSSIW